MPPGRIASEFRRRAIKYLIEKKLITSDNGVSNPMLMRLLQLDFGMPPNGKAERYEFFLKALPRKRAAKSFYTSEIWKRLRYQALKLHGAACQCCGNAASPDKPLHVDHIKPRSKYPELELEISNLQVLCADCNLGKSAWDDTDWRANTNVIPFPNVMGL